MNKFEKEQRMLDIAFVLAASGTLCALFSEGILAIYPTLALPITLVGFVLLTTALFLLWKCR